MKIYRKVEGNGVTAMKCHYCEEIIEETVQPHSAMRNKKTNQIAYLHSPDCKVRFGTFHKTKKELIEEGILK